MSLKVNLRRLSLLILPAALLLAVGCAIQDPQALNDLSRANKALASAKEKGAADRFPEDYAALEMRYLEARGTFYACDEAEASNMAMSIIEDANALGDKRMMAAPAAPVPANNPPVARLRAPVEGLINKLLTFNANESSDPDDDKLTYRWDYGDGKMGSFRFPVATHRYNSIGSYTVKLTVDDGRGGTDSTSAVVLVGRKEVIQGHVLFDTDKFVIKSEGKMILDKIVAHLKENNDHRIHLVGHTDSTGSKPYNMKLSKRRANVVKRYFVKRDIAESRIVSEWKGQSEPVASNKTRDGRAKNRRTEITIKPPM